MDSAIHIRKRNCAHFSRNSIRNILKHAEPVPNVILTKDKINKLGNIVEKGLQHLMSRMHEAKKVTGYRKCYDICQKYTNTYGHAGIFRGKRWPS